MTECLEFTGHRDKDGYGRVHHKGKQVPAHRLAYAVANDLEYTAIPSSMVVRHKCDNPSCVEPTHLELGTQQDNQQDVIKRGRLGLRKGFTNNQAVLPDETIAAIRAEYTGKRGELTALGKKYGVSRVSIKNYVSGRYR